MTWVLIFDQSFQRVPAANYAAVYAAGYRVMAGYVAGGSGGKWVTAAEVRAWLACGPDTGFLPLFEAAGDEPVNSPGSAAAHARAARAGARDRGVPDTVAISPAMDRNVTISEAKGPIATYMRGWKAADTMPPLPYIELDAGAYLYTAGLTVGTGTPAAYTWDPSNELVTPANAPAHVLWTQEHNGVALHGGDVDTGHIRTTAPIWWPNVPTEDDMAVTEASIWGYKTPDNETAIGAVQDGRIYAKAARDQATAIAATLAGVVKTEAAIQAALAAITSGGTSVDTTALAAQIKAVGDQESTTVAKLSAQIADLTARLEKAAVAEAAALNGSAS